MLEKIKPLRDKKYLAWLSKQPCIFTNVTPSDPHHVKLLGGGGMSIKPPDNHAIPIAHWIHVMLDSPGHSELSVLGAHLELDTKVEVRDRLKSITEAFYNKYKSEKE